MTDQVPPMPPKCQPRVQAVLALFRGEANRVIILFTSVRT
jgi:hypothetical protein